MSIPMPEGQLGPPAPVPFSELILPAFGGQLDIRAAYTWCPATVITPRDLLPSENC